MNLKNRETNFKLIQLLKRGDMVAFDTIYKKYSNKLYHFVIRYLKTKEDAEEIVQEVFIKIWESRRKIDMHSSFESFLFTIAYNSTISLLRKRVSELKYREKMSSVQQITNSQEVVDDIQFKELNEKLLSILGELTPRQREIFQLSRQHGLSHKEISKKLNISENTVKNHLVKALAVLKVRIDNGLISSLLYFSLFFL